MTRLVPHRCPACGETVSTFASATVEHRCPKDGRRRVFKVDAQPSEPKGKP